MEEKTIETKILAISLKEGQMPGVYIKPDETAEPQWLNAIDMESGEQIKKLMKFCTAKILMTKGTSGKWLLKTAIKTKEPDTKSYFQRKPDDPYNNTSFNNGCMVNASQYVLEITKSKPLKAEEWGQLVAAYTKSLHAEIKSQQSFSVIQKPETKESTNDATEEKVTDGEI